MIERDDFMSDKKYTTEELTKKVEEAKKAFECLNEQLQQQKKEEEAKRQAELELEKEARIKEIEIKEKELNELVHLFIKDYGSFYTARNSNDLDHILKMFF